MSDLAAILGTGPSVTPTPAPTQADVDAMASLRDQAASVVASLSPTAARITSKRAQVATLTQQLQAAKGGT